MVSRHYSRLIFFFTTGILVMVSYIFFLLFGPYTAPNASGLRFTLPVTAGSLARYQFDTCYTTDQEATISRTLIGLSTDPSVLIGVDAPVTRPLRCTNVLLIPEATPAGDYRLLISATYRVNPLRTVTREYESSVFHLDNSNPKFVIPPATSAPAAVVPVPTQSNESTENTSPSPSQSGSSSRPSQSPSPSPAPSSKRGPIQRIIDDVMRFLDQSP